ncbi:hypothetical protein GLOIN_2v1600448 [Rhizophagus clarus]|uniref:Uncharacterized protein n=1 Tax=Rhizophagus clarus TaxID=94130 RepID=A0A8H3M4B3_9GLOM|nr:hypothetical protein GLOIN_2v1600448 [Rhizophagus clarus]
MNNFDNNQMDQEDKLGSDQEEVNNIETHYDYYQIYLKALLDSVSEKSIKEIWQITSYIIPSSYQHIVIFEDNIYICCASDRFLPQIEAYAPQIKIVMWDA